MLMRLGKFVYKIVNIHYPEIFKTVMKIAKYWTIEEGGAPPATLTTPTVSGVKLSDYTM